MGVVAFIIANWEILATAAGAIGIWYKDAIMSKIGIRKGSGEADSIHIQNSEQLMVLYSRAMTDLKDVHDTYIIQIKEKQQEEIENIRAEHKKNLEEIRDEHKNILLIREHENAAKNNSLQLTVLNLEKQVNKLTELVEKLGRQISFYQENSDIILPEDLH